MPSVYESYLEKAKELNCSPALYEKVREVMVVAEKAELPLRDVSEITDTFEFAMSLGGAQALYNSYKALGDEGRIVYQNKDKEIVRHYANGRIEIVEIRDVTKPNLKQ